MSRGVVCDPETGFDDQYVRLLKEKAYRFLESCREVSGGYSLTPVTDSSAFTDCFAIFLYHLVGRLDHEILDFSIMADRIVNGLRVYKKIREDEGVQLNKDKGYLQLLSFSLSALFLLDAQKRYPLDDLVVPILPIDIQQYLHEIKAAQGVARSGNLAMCIAIISIYADRYIDKDSSQLINDWINFHLDAMNRYGFWGSNKMTHLQFQNGYHQYEIFEYLDTVNNKLDAAAEYILSLSDRRGQYAPYFGGSGCYDYDAISIICAHQRDLNEAERTHVIQTAQTILSEQNGDGGFSESQWIRPRSLKTFGAGIGHVLSAPSMSMIMERGRYFAALQSPKHDRMHTHWTHVSRKWSESNLWDTWFRLLTIARIDVALNKENFVRWGFIDFPGIGFCRQ